MDIPDYRTPDDIKTAIKDHRPKGSKNGEIGEISLVYVLKAWRRQGIALTLLSETFKEVIPTMNFPVKQ
ncbi:hypothetical protein Pmar_PMAR024098 [Perkinsus marinus ATCC 50983]|uniref:N-acetyltransferase domain-containing protein n=1 Tax=Perkinsus marinus (strain ATCC 50983 / TXsc) TaxID=423536 RepID=C5L6M9_PERM5|nr:hypothetical protein Pmar_PMAR024098 [Perkinsus marinus ATCC 50983]EER07690.1 hypothetical protein Pmar_PMAR024098 [Perkinsus marinus ATCC 50983]|eukprot:XP_002775874.1 hypothetical protein Pmar_PMAR024098 [Perkinsus marinus ATCC 50983]